MTIRIGDIAPDFQASTTRGDISFHEWLGDSWGILFSHPKVFTPVCTTELGEVARLTAEFQQRNVKVLGLSVDNKSEQINWEADIHETQNHKVNFPMVADESGAVANQYDMIHPNANNTLTVRSVFIIDQNKKVRLMITYPASTGRNFQEILRVVDSLQLTDNYKVATPVNWTKGDDVIIIPALSDEDAKKLFPNGWNTIKPYLRVVKDPS